MVWIVCRLSNSIVYDGSDGGCCCSCCHRNVCVCDAIEFFLFFFLLQFLVLLLILSIYMYEALIHQIVGNNSRVKCDVVLLLQKIMLLASAMTVKRNFFLPLPLFLFLLLLLLLQKYNTQETMQKNAIPEQCCRCCCCCC